MVTAQSIIPKTIKERMVRPAERQERPRWCADSLWQAAITETTMQGYTGHDRYARAAERLADRYGYR